MVAFEHSSIYMGPWDIMSQHFVKQGEPPPGLSSFTKIRLGWITTKEARLVRPGENALAFLSPLSLKGDTLVVKIPLAGGQYYLIENRQPLGFDRVLPDSGMVILRVNPEADEGFGTVELMNADPEASHFSRATFKAEVARRSHYVDQRSGVAIIPLWRQERDLGVLITTPGESDAALKATQEIVKLMVRWGSAPSGETGKVLREAIAAFKNFEFSKSSQISRALLGND